MSKIDFPIGNAERYWDKLAFGQWITYEDLPDIDEDDFYPPERPPKPPRGPETPPPSPSPVPNSPRPTEPHMGAEVEINA